MAHTTQSDHMPRFTEGTASTKDGHKRWEDLRARIEKVEEDGKLRDDERQESVDAPRKVSHKLPFCKCKYDRAFRICY